MRDYMAAVYADSHAMDLQLPVYAERRASLQPFVETATRGIELLASASDVVVNGLRRAAGVKYTCPRKNLAVGFSRLPPAHPSSLIVNTCTWSRSRHDPPASRGFGQSGCRRGLGPEIPVGLFVEDGRADLTPLGAGIVLGQVVLALISSAASPPPWS